MKTEARAIVILLSLIAFIQIYTLFPKEKENANYTKFHICNHCERVTLTNDPKEMRHEEDCKLNVLNTGDFNFNNL